jgi:hypothetical protein
MLKHIALSLLTCTILSFGCKTTSSNSAVSGFPESYDTVCGMLNDNILTTSPSKNTYLLDPADGASLNTIEALNGSEVCVTADFSFKEVLVRSAHYIVAKYENLCGKVSLDNSVSKEDYPNGLFKFKVGNEEFTIEPGDGAVLNYLNSNISKQSCFYADFREKEVIIESMSNIK